MNLVKLAVYRPIAMLMVILFILIIGFVALFGLAIDLFPELEFPIAAVLVEYPGIGPYEIENLVTAPLENILGTISNIENISSTSRLGGALIIVEFTWGTDMNFATLEMRERIDLVRQSLPADVPQPTVLRFDPRTLPIMQLAISSSEHHVTELKRIIEYQIKPRLEPIEGIAAVNVTGGEEKEIRLYFNHQQLTSYGLSLQHIQHLLLAENINLPGGIITDQNMEIPLRILGNFQTIQELEDFPILTATGQIIRLKDIATVKETIKPTGSMTFLNSERSIGLSIQKETDANTVNVARAVNRMLKQLEQDLPEHISMEPIFDQSIYINQSIRTLATNMFIGSILAAAILFLFLRNLRSTFIVAMAIPLSIMTTFTLMYFSKQTLNLLTLGGLALGVGMMVDNAIVILENIYRYRQNGHPIKVAAVEGTTEVGRAVIASTLTTVIVFLPIVFVDGLAAQLFKPLALTVTYALLASLFTALIIVPLLSSKLVLVLKGESRFQKIFEHWRANYTSLLQWSLTRPKKVIGGVFIVLIISLLAIPFLGTEFLPELDQSMIYLDVRLPVGSTIEASLRLTEEVNRRLEQIPEITNIYVQVGGVGQFQLAAGTLANRSNYNLQLLPIHQRSRSDKEIAEEVRKLLENMPGVRVNVSTGDDGLGGSPIYLQVRGEDPLVLQSLANDIISVISAIEGIREAQSDFTAGQEEIQIQVDRLRAAQYGLTSWQVAQKINETLTGITASRLTRSGEEIDIRLLYEPKKSEQLDVLLQTEIDSPLGFPVSLGSLVVYKEEKSPHSIKRTKRLREVAVSAQLLNRDLGSAISEIRKKLKEEIYLPSGYSIHFGGQNEQMLDAFTKLAGALCLAVILVYMTLSAQFESFFYPFIIMFTVPLTIIGVIPGLLLTGQALGVSALVGLLVLTGIVVNNGIIFVDYVNTLRKQGKTREEALLMAGSVRLRPILMTALTTIIGLIPLMLGFGEGAEIQAPMATVIIFGLSSATFLTLILIPVLYNIFDEWRERKHDSKQRNSLNE